MFWPRQLEIVEEHVRDAVEKGAKVLCGGKRADSLPGLFYEPTVLVDVTPEMKVMREETFGPVLPITRVRNEEEALRLANDSAYGLGATIWSKDRERAMRLARRLDAGSVCVNDMTMTYGAIEAPFGGRRESGVGHVNGVDALRNWCWAQPILVDRFGGKQTASHFPYSEAKDAGMQKMMRFLWGTRLGRWLA
jgi:succinate-semialdehyde dehydrogenase/glutarate-semialdehyde dehydrogenase